MLTLVVTANDDSRLISGCLCGAKILENCVFRSCAAVYGGTLPAVLVGMSQAGDEVLYLDANWEMPDSLAFHASIRRNTFIMDGPHIVALWADAYATAKLRKGVHPAHIKGLTQIPNTFQVRPCS